MTNITATELYAQQVKGLPLEERLRLLALLAGDLAIKLQAPNQSQPSLSAEEMQAAHERLERHFGAVDLGRPTGIDNQGIDRDLAREYGGGR